MGLLVLGKNVLERFGGFSERKRFWSAWIRHGEVKDSL